MIETMLNYVITAFIFIFIAAAALIIVGFAFYVVGCMISNEKSDNGNAEWLNDLMFFTTISLLFTSFFHDSSDWEDDD